MSNLITINPVDCKDCYKCVRACQVKAIRVVAGHAEVVEERCLGDGACVIVCPQRAKVVRRDVEVVRGLLATGRPVVASVAPAARGVFGLALPSLLGALRRLGFARLEETARAAGAVARASAACAAESAGPRISTACPAVVSLIGKYYPALAEALVPVPSPLVAHARLIREEMGPEVAVVFIGPCVAKKGEATGDDLAAALTFDELLAWLAEEQLELAQQAPATFDHPPVGRAGLFPLPNGMLECAGEIPEVHARRVLTVAGMPAVPQLLDEFATLTGVQLIEALACEGGCLQGPGASQGPAPWARRMALLDGVSAAGVGAAPRDLTACFAADPVILPQPSSEELAALLRRTGKLVLADEHNCGACGYDTCRQKAVAVFQGMAEAEMCIPYMRSRAESFAQVVLRVTPNGIVILDGALRILDANPAFARIFGRTMPELLGRTIKSVLDPSGFERVQRTGQPFSRLEVTYGTVTAREMICPLPEGELLLGIYVDVTDEVARQRRLQTVKGETLRKARLVIDKQMRVAQEIAGLLGETTAETKVLLTRLIALSEAEDEG
jgi:iron only hydrogenase large subunit-like protein